MLKSLYSGVSGLTNHQMKLDVLGNNIANINTVGYKGGRINFSEALNQTIASATPGRGTGYINPIQVGLGMKTSSIENIFSQGSLENTGIITDLAIEGEGFFIMKAGENSLYSRAGQFYFNSNGKLVNQRGLAVQGWMYNENVNAAGFSPGNMSDLVIDSNKISEAAQTNNIYLSGNLNAGLETTYEVWSSPEENYAKAMVTGTLIPGAVTVTAGVNDDFNIEIASNASTNINESITLTAGNYADANALVAQLNTQIAANSNLDGRVEAVNVGGSIQLRQVAGSENTTITLTDGTNTVLGDLGFTDGDTGSATEAVGTSNINDLIYINSSANALVAGDTIQISGTNPDGSTLSAVFTYGAANDGTTINDLVTVIDASYTDVSVAFTDGKIVLTDDIEGDSETSISLSNGASNTGTVNFPSFTNTTPGVTGKTTTSIVTYDSLGAAHNLIMNFEKTTTDGLWNWSLSSSTDENITSGGSGQVMFDDSGQIISFTYDGGVNEVTMDPGNGAELMTFSIHSDDVDDFSGLTQLDAVSTVIVREQDGRSTGTLLGLTITREGTISGSFSNGEIEDLAKIALAKFPNYGGLNDLGDGMFQESIASGDVQVVNLQGNDASGSIVSGALEMSNVDLSSEFTDMITTQRGFQANAKVITTADTILDELIRLKR
jgi:flagellar hook protein FlgE